MFISRIILFAFKNWKFASRYVSRPVCLGLQSQLATFVFHDTAHDTASHDTAPLSTFSSLKSPTCCTKPRVALDGNKLFQRQVICGFRDFIDNLKTLFYKRNKKNLVAVTCDSRVITTLEMHVKHSAVASCFTRISHAVITR